MNQSSLEFQANERAEGQNVRGPHRRIGKNSNIKKTKKFGHFQDFDSICYSRRDEEFPMLRYKSKLAQSVETRKSDRES